MTSPRPRLTLFVTLDLPPDQDGGVGALVDGLARDEVARGGEVWVMTRGRRGPGRLLSEPPRPYRVTRRPGRSWRRWGSLYLTLWVPLWCLWKRPSRLVGATWETVSLLVFLDRWMEVVALASGRDVTAPLSPQKEHKRLQILRRAKVWALSRWMKGSLESLGVDPGGITVFTPKILPAPFHGPAGGETILCLGRLIPRKGQDQLLRALPHLPRARLLLVGRGPDESRLRGIARELEVEDRVEFLGYLADPDPAWRRASIYAMPCREEADGDSEGYGLTFLEAGARGLPVVGGRTGGVPEAVLEGVTGLLVEPQDGEGLVAALGELLGDPQRGRALGEAGRRRVVEGFLVGRGDK